MPTGYTADVNTGEVTELAPFLRQIARGMGFLIMMRDDPLDAPIPERFEPHTKYHDEKIAEAERLLEELPSLSLEECERRSEAEWAAEVERIERRRENDLAIKARYEAMIKKVEAWSPPEDLEEMKDFALSQLRESLKFDCSLVLNPPEKQDGDTWRYHKLKDAARDRAYHAEQRAQEIKRADERNRYLLMFRREMAKFEAPTND